MIKNYIAIAFRNFWRNKSFSAINILGLSIGISAALVIFLIAFYEFSFDRSVPDSDRVYRVVMDININGSEGHASAVIAPLGAAVQSELTGVEQVIPVFQFQGDGNAKVSIAKPGSDNPIVFKKQTNVVFTKAEYFYMLPHQWLAGSPEISLKEPFSTVISESRAKQYFPSIPVADIIGKKIVYNDNLTTSITGIVKDLNENTSLSAIEFISLATIAKTHLQETFMMNVWNDWMAYAQLYLKLTPGTEPAQMENLLTGLIKKNNKDAKGMINSVKCHLQPLADIHFNNKYPGIGQRIAQKPVLYNLLFIAAFLLLLGCINFINLTTANATSRAKEIGIRKTMGSSKKLLVFQFLGETFFITVFATLLSLCLTPILLSSFNNFIPPGLRFEAIDKSAILLFLLIIAIVVSFLSGIYPALVLSGFRPVSILKGQSFANSKESRNVWVRKSLTVSQFVIAQFFIIATIVVSKQINFSTHSDLGFNKDAIITFQLPNDTLPSRPNQLLQTIKSIPEVAIASSGFLSPAGVGVAFTNIKYEGKEDIKDQIQIRIGDPDFLQVYQIKLLAGRNVLPSDRMKEFIINDTYSKLLGFQKPEESLGKFLEFNGEKLPIVGVMQDFHDLSMRGNISPLVFAGNNGSMFHIRLNPNDEAGNTWKNGILKIQGAFKVAYPDVDFDYSFFDDNISKMYENETRTASLLKWATGLSIFISCLGLLGLVMYTINTRIKEIGIRKILGSSVTNIVSVLSGDFISLILIAFLIAAPLSWWAMHHWLDDFAFKTQLNWWIFLISGVSMVLIAVLTLSIHTLKAALANPVKSLRNE